MKANPYGNKKLHFVEMKFTGMFFESFPICGINRWFKFPATDKSNKTTCKNCKKVLRK